MGNIALIPARAGSKRIVKKNIRPFLGKPIIAYSIEAAQMSHCFDRIIVSTDSDEIKEIALSLGAEVPFIRPASLSDDHATTIEVIKHAIGWLEEQQMMPELLCCIYATAPFINPSYILEGADKLLSNPDASYAFSLTSFPFPIQRAVKINEGKIQMFNPEHFNSRSQDLEESFHDAGQFYWGRPSAFMEDVPMFSEASIPILLPRYLTQDIDTEEDWLRAELLYKAHIMSEESSDKNE